MTKETVKPETKLIDAIYDAHGGVSKVSRKLGFSRQKCMYWRDVGKVSEACIEHSAQMLHVPIAALLPRTWLAPYVTWRDIILDCNLPQSVERELIKCENY